MKSRFKPKKKLRKNIKIYLYIIMVLPIIIYMQKNNPLKHLFISCVNKYMNKDFIKSKDSINNVITSMVFNSSNEENIKSVNTVNNDKMFSVKEEKVNDPIVYLYNTHQTENYKKIDGTSFEPNIMIATDYLKEKISNSGINTIVEKRNISDVLLKNNWSYGSSYRVSRSFIESTINEYQSIKYLFDIHRDSGSHEYTTLCINNKCYAKILFLIGLENANYIENQEYAENLSKRLNNKVNGISKGILQKQGPKVNGVYNEDFSNRTILIEVGGENNTIDEVYNTIDVLSEVIIDYIKEEYYGI